MVHGSNNTEHSTFLKQTCKRRRQEKLVSLQRAGRFHCFDNFFVPAILFCCCKYILFLGFLIAKAEHKSHSDMLYMFLFRLLGWLYQTFSCTCLILFGFSNLFLSSQAHVHKQAITGLEKNHCLHTLLPSASFSDC